MSALRILLIEDSPFDAELVERALARDELELVVERVEDEEGFRRALGAFGPDVILSDYQLPTFAGMDALYVVRDLGLDVPFIFVSGALGDEEAVECIREGATDYVLKDRLVRLAPAITRALAEREAQRDRRRLEDRVRAQEQRMAHILRTMPAGFFTMDRELLFTYVNPAAEAMWEIPAEQLLGRSSIEAFPGMQDTEFARAAKSATGEPVFLEAEYPPKQKWYEVHAYPTDEGYAVYFRDVTERHRAAAALREAEDRYRTIVEQLPAITYVDDYVGGEGGLLYVSPQVESILGFRRDEWIGDPDFWWRHTHPDDRDAVEELDEASRNEGTPFEAEYRMIAEDGRIVWFHDRATVLVDPSGKRVVHGVMLDVTQRKEAEAALRRADAVLGAVTYAADRLLRDAEWEAGVEAVLARVGEATSAARAVTIELVGEPGSRRGYAIQEWCARGVAPRIQDLQDVALEAPGNGWLDRLAKGESIWADSATATPALRDVLGRIGAPAAAMIPLFTGERFWGFATFVDSEDGRPWAPAVMDALTAAANALGAAIGRAEALTALERSERDFRSLAENATDVIARCDRDLRFVYVNPVVRELDRHVGQLVGASADALLAPSAPASGDGRVLGRERWLELLRSAFDRGERETVEADHPTQRGVRTFEWRLIPEPDETGEIESLLLLGRDVTGRVLAERGQRASYEALIRSNEQRRQLLARLVRAQEEERQRIANDIHDDPIQVMTAVGMRLSLASRGVTDPTALSDLAEAEDTVRLAIERLRRLLFELHPLSLDSDGLTAALRDHCHLMTKDGGPESEIDDRLSSEPPPESRVILYRLAQEALTNVRKHAEAASVAITMRSEQGGTFIAIRDDGVGFEVDPSRPDPGHLGVRSMVERAESAGGWCRIDSGPGRGTTVEYWIPSIAPPMPTVGAEAPPTDPGTSADAVQA